jgi:hypothetical protein
VGLEIFLVIIYVISRPQTDNERSRTADRDRSVVSCALQLWAYGRLPLSKIYLPHVHVQHSSRGRVCAHTLTGSRETSVFIEPKLPPRRSQECLLDNILSPLNRVYIITYIYIRFVLIISFHASITVQSRHFA